MSFPASPTNGQTAVVNNITYQYSTSNNSWTKIAALVSSNIAAYTGNITSNLSSTSTTTGALVVYGGQGVTGNLNVGGNVVTSIIDGATTLTLQSNNTTVMYMDTGGNLFANTATAFQSLASFQSVTEAINPISGATGTVTHDFSTGAIWYHTNIASNFTANFINVPVTNNKVIVCTLILNQGSTPSIANVVQIAGSAQTIKWQGNTIPTGYANKVDMLSFSLIRAQNTWTVTGSLSTYG